MNFVENRQLDLLIALAYPLKGNAYIYNYILKTVDTFVEIPPQIGKSQILDLICKIFSDPKYENEKNKISQIVMNINRKKGGTILKMIQLIAIFRPKNELVINPMYTTLSKKLSLIPEGYLDSFIDSIGKMQYKLSFIENKINIEKLIEIIKKLVRLYKNKGGNKSSKSRKTKKSMKYRKSRKTIRNNK